MKNLIVSAARYLRLRNNASKARTSMVPISRIRSVAVVLDSPEAADAVNKYFTPKHIDVKIYKFAKDDLSVFGWPKEGKFAAEHELFINLLELPEFYAEYCARCSKARFKIGRTQLPSRFGGARKGSGADSKLDGLYDLVITKSEGFSQKAVFDQICMVLDKLR